MDDVFLSILGYDLGKIFCGEDTLALVVFALFNIHITLHAIGIGFFDMLALLSAVFMP